MLSFYSRFLLTAILALAMPLTLPRAAHASDVETNLNQLPTMNECSFQWEVRARGISLGITHDTVRWGKASTSVVSLFTPNAIASMLGAPTLERKWFSSKNQGIVRDENKYKGKDEPDKVRWTAKGAKLWQTVNQEPRQEFPAPDGADMRFIDSTIFAYLDLVGQPVSTEPTTTWVLNRQAPYQASTSRTNETVEYNAGNKRGTVWVSAGKPTKLTFFEGRDNFEAKVVSANCK